MADAEATATSSELVVDIFRKFAGDVFRHLFNGGIDRWRSLLHRFQKLGPLLHLQAPAHGRVAAGLQLPAADVSIPEGASTLAVGPR